MPPVDEIAVLRRAKHNCERDGCIWDASVWLTLKPDLPTKPALDRASRARYLAHARKELLDEHGRQKH